MPENNQNPLTFVTSTVGNTAGGVAKTASGIIKATGRRVGDTVTGVTGSAGKPVKDALYSLGDGVEGGAKNIGDSVQDTGQDVDSWDVSDYGGNLCTLRISREGAADGGLNIYNIYNLLLKER